LAGRLPPFIDYNLLLKPINIFLRIIYVSFKSTPLIKNIKLYLMPTIVLSKVMCPAKAGSTILICSLIILFGCYFHIPVQTSIYGSIKFNTALCFAMLSICLINASTKKIAPYLFLFIKMGILAYCIASLLQDYFSLELGIDQLFYNESAGEIQRNLTPGRIPPLTALLFILVCIGLIGIIYIKKHVSCFQYFFHSVTFVSFIILVGYIIKVPALYSFSFQTVISIYTALLFFFLSIGASLLSPSTGLTAVFTIHNTGNIIARRLFLQMMFAIIAITYIRFEVHQYNIIDSDSSIGLMVIAYVITSMIFTLKASKRLNYFEISRNIAEERFKLVVESAPNALVMSDSNGRITLVNVRGESLFGYKREELIGQKIEVLIPPKFRRNHPSNRDLYHMEPVSRYFGAGAELHAVNKSGMEFPVEVGLNSIQDGNETSVLASIIDITDRRKQETQIKEQLIELKVKNQEMEQFNYIASHDLQEPLRTVSNYIMLLKEDYPDQIDEEIEIHLGMMDSAVSRMSMLVRSMLDFGRLGRDKKLIETDCNVCLANVIADLNNLINKNGATVVIEGILPVINVYEVEFRQLFQNLINNAIKFKNEDVSPIIKIGFTQKEEAVEFYVSDNGIGIDQKYSKRIFQIFQRLHNNEKFEGHGIGLANCKKIAEMHGGTIWVESNFGEGSTFKFTISNL
jgi:PAS domain S-box-containing protein